MKSVFMEVMSALILSFTIGYCLFFQIPLSVFGIGFLALYLIC
ncbi:hypothetical protein [Legionella shakespearei]|nr:hypothetical protein [Legionella shakespearei]